MKRKLLLIVNPNSGKGNISKKINKLIQNFEKLEYTIDTIYTKKGSPILEDVQEHLCGIDLIVCCGGDGTLNETINIILKLNITVKLSFIPLGTMNDFSRTIKISKKQIYYFKKNKKLKIISSDIGIFNDKYFNYVAAFGAFTKVAYDTPQKLKNLFGKIAYFIQAIRELFKIKPYKAKVQFNGKEIEEEFLYGGISNSRFVGGFKWYNKKDVELDDGQFELLLIKNPKNMIQFMKTLILLLVKKYKEPYFIFEKVSNIKFTMLEDVIWTIDGEKIGKTKVVEIQNINKRIEYVIPCNKNGGVKNEKIINSNTNVL
jgi:YegS/Rv2252/BmrU family lipid kinase